MNPTALETDEIQRPDLFVWNGPVARQRLESWLLGLRLELPEDLKALWERTGGGDLFETETILGPLSGTGTDDAAEENRTFRANGLSAKYFVFHVGLGGYSAVRAPDAAYVQLSLQFDEVAQYRSLDDWYRRVLRAEYGARYGLTAMADDETAPPTA